MAFQQQIIKTPFFEILIILFTTGQKNFKIYYNLKEY